MKYPIEAFHSPHRIYWHPICTMTRINEKCWPSVSHVYSSTDSHCKPNTEEPRSAKTHKNWMRAYKQPDKAKQTHASKQHDGGHSKLTVYTVYPLATSPPCGEWGVKTCHENKNNSSSIFNIQIHTDKLLSKNIFSTFFYFFTLLVHNSVVFSWVQWW